MDIFDQLVSQPDIRRFFDLVWRTFGVNPALVSPNGDRLVIHDSELRAQPFCRSLGTTVAGRELCSMCDRSRFLEARRDGQALRYRCHAGLTEFIIPVIRSGEIIAMIQCGQVHHKLPTDSEWSSARQSLIGAGIQSNGLQKLYKSNRVLGMERQNDLLELLDLVAQRIGNSDFPAAATSGQSKVILGRAITYIETHLGESLNLETVSRNAGFSPRSLMRLFRSEMSTTVIEFIHTRRVSKARQMLSQTDKTCAEIAFECGFGSVQHFNRIFRRIAKSTPTAWRENHEPKTGIERKVAR